MDLPFPLEAWREARARRHEAEAVTDAELEGWGLSRADFRALALMPPKRIARMEAMAGIHGVDPARLDADPALRREVALACAKCREWALCTASIGDWAEASEMEFCPNHATFERLAAPRPGL